nr:uncharacterized protein LOC110568651 [Aotus nancymaae]
MDISSMETGCSRPDTPLWGSRQVGPRERRVPLPAASPPRQDPLSSSKGRGSPRGWLSDDRAHLDRVSLEVPPFPSGGAAGALVTSGHSPAPGPCGSRAGVQALQSGSTNSPRPSGTIGLVFSTLDPFRVVSPRAREAPSARSEKLRRCLRADPPRVREVSCGRTHPPPIPFPAPKPAPQSLHLLTPHRSYRKGRSQALIPARVMAKLGLSFPRCRTTFVGAAPHPPLTAGGSCQGGSPPRCCSQIRQVNDNLKVSFLLPKLRKVNGKDASSTYSQVENLNRELISRPIA